MLLRASAELRWAMGSLGLLHDVSQSKNEQRTSNQMGTLAGKCALNLRHKIRPQGSW